MAEDVKACLQKVGMLGLGWLRACARGGEPLHVGKLH